MSEENEKEVGFFRLIQNLHRRVQRVEVLMGLENPPEEWNITEDRVVKIMEQTGEPFDKVVEKLIVNFGEDNHD